MSDQTEDARCTDWNHVWMQGCKTCVEQETEARVLLSKPNIELSAVYGYEAGRSDGLAEARNAVAALPPLELDDAIGGWDPDVLEWTKSRPVIARDNALAAIDGLQTSTSRPTPTGQRDVGPSVSPAGEELRGTNDAAVTEAARRGYEKGCQYAAAKYPEIHAAALDAARDAVAALGCNDQCGCSVTIPNALAAIDALEKP